MTIAALAALGSPAIALQVNASPTNAYSTASGGGTQVTNLITVSSLNGVAPFTYAWTLVSGVDIDIDSDDTASTTFSADVGFGETITGVARCTVTDSIGSTGFVDVGITMIDISIQIWN